MVAAPRSPSKTGGFFLAVNVVPARFGNLVCATRLHHHHVGMLGFPFAELLHEHLALRQPGRDLAPVLTLILP